MPVYNGVQLITILNDANQLAAFPVEGTLSLLFNNQLDEQNINEYIYLIKQKPVQGNPNIANTDVRYIGDMGIFPNSIIPYSWSTSSAPAGYTGIVYTIKPTEPLMPDGDYWIVVSTNTAPLFYSISKTHSLGPSIARLIVTPQANTSDLSGSTTYTLTVTTSSVIANGANTITYNLVGGSLNISGASLETVSQAITLDSGITVKFNGNIPILAGEIYTIILTNFARLGTTSIQKFNTFITSDVIPVPPAEQSTRLSQANILDFYEKNGYARRIGEDPLDQCSDANVPDADEIRADTRIWFNYPGTIFFEVGDGTYSLDPATVTADAFIVQMGPAFNNFLLGNLYDPANRMYQYNNSSQYVLKYKLIDNDFGVSNIIRLTVVEDNTGTVPTGQLFIVEADT